MPPIYSKTDAWKRIEEMGGYLCITTNGFVKSNGEAVMGRGIAKEAANRFSMLPKLLGDTLRTRGNNVHLFTLLEYNHQLDMYLEFLLITFPVKPISKKISDLSEVVSHMHSQFKSGDVVPGWACKAELSLIRQSCKQLMELVNNSNMTGEGIVVLPFPGIGNGELSRENVQKILDEELDQRVLVVYR
jgi:hypothetical protein